MVEIGYDTKPRNWYRQTDTEQVGFTAQNRDEEALDELTPDGEKDVFKSHLERGGVETSRPHEVIVRKIEDGSFYREVYKRPIDDLDTADETLQGLREATYLIQLSQGNDSAAAHRHDSIEFANMPDNVQNIFKTHDDYEWRRE